MSTDFIVEVKKFKQKEGVFYFFKKGGLYYATEQEAEIIASRYLRSYGSLKETSTGVRFVQLMEQMYISLLRDLLLYDRKSIELYEFETNAWRKAYEASPGNVSSVIDLINNDLDISKSSLLLALSATNKNGQIYFDAACCDSTLFTIATTEFIDSSPSLVYYENLINQTMPSEIIFCDIGEPMIQTLQKITTEYGIPFRETQAKNLKDPGSRFPNTKSVKVLLSSLSINAEEFTHKSFKLTDFMTVDHSASNALNIFPEDQKNNRGLPTSLYQLLNQCVTPMGSRLLHQFLQQPLLDKQKIEERLNIVSAFFDHLDIVMTVRDHMKQIPDIARLMRKFKNGRANLQDCVRMHDIALIIPRVAEIKNVGCDSLAELGAQLEEQEQEAGKIVKLVQQTIDFDLIPQHIYRITPEFNEELRKMADDMNDVKNRMERICNRIADDAGIDADKMKVERMPNIKRYYMRTGRTLEKNLRNNSEIDITETRKDGVRFTTTKFNALNDQFFELEENYNQTQKAIAVELFETLAGYAPMFEILNDIFAQVDVFMALAKFASDSPSNYVRPELVLDGEELTLIQARHPLVERHVQFIPNDIHMERSNSSFIIISGPNCAGKSTLLKTVGCIVFLAHIGSFVPCDNAIIPLTTSIHARVGAWDTPTRSTFTIEMEEMSGILRSAGSKSLILVDELGRSTSCSDGFGLAWAISEKIAKDIGAFTLFATHFHELCDLENQIQCVTNYHMDASSSETLFMTYKLKEGPFPTSFGIDAAEKAGFPKEVIERAKDKAVELELADRKEGNRPSRVTIDPNTPYRNFLRGILTIDFENTPPKDSISACTNMRAQFDKEKNNTNISSE